MIQLSGVTLRPGEAETLLARRAEKALGCPVTQLRILRKSLDARKKNDVRWVYTLACACANENAALKRCAKASRCEPQAYEFPAADKTFAHRPVVIGAGPGGLFCALMLARSGAKPILLERGKCIEERALDVHAHRAGGPLRPGSNLQFGEGGAGTFSDGKLNTGVNDPRMAYLLKQFVHFGAPAEVAYLAAPHVGTDNLRKVVRAIRAVCSVR